ncbi:uncharacterized protein B0H18DRAFT_951624 [Fomitopsis serialis]|uniref:uncharacterized protein n=1 Tax=Fomitopsis serialis TaxID=139415 RepID=UPI002007D787|nr:uncharacterized protein B0H18DRAFT_951624 [Neoantrodia serialis]KAH9934266.1 hypothetical protein B0H18DRAFT_951624 [Neoantrodia serialis]
MGDSTARSDASCRRQIQRATPPRPDGPTTSYQVWKLYAATALASSPPSSSSTLLEVLPPPTHNQCNTVSLKLHPPECRLITDTDSHDGLTPNPSRLEHEWAAHVQSILDNHRPTVYRVGRRIELNSTRDGHDTLHDSHVFILLAIQLAMLWHEETLGLRVHIMSSLWTQNVHAALPVAPRIRTGTVKLDGQT